MERSRLMITFKTLKIHCGINCLAEYYVPARSPSDHGYYISQGDFSVRLGIACRNIDRNIPSGDLLQQQNNVAHIYLAVAVYITVDYHPKLILALPYNGSGRNKIAAAENTILYGNDCAVIEFRGKVVRRNLAVDSANTARLTVESQPRLRFQSQCLVRARDRNPKHRSEKNRRTQECGQNFSVFHEIIPPNSVEMSVSIL